MTKKKQKMMSQCTKDSPELPDEAESRRRRNLLYAQMIVSPPNTNTNNNTNTISITITITM